MSIGIIVKRPIRVTMSSDGMREIALEKDKLHGHVADLWREGLAKSPTVSFSTRGGSMRPLVFAGSTVYVESVAPEDVRVGDLVVFAYEGKLVAHRVISLILKSGERSFITKGDFLPFPDAEVGEKEIVGRVVAIKKGARIIRLDRGWWRAISRMVALLSPWSRWIIGPLKFIRYRFH